MSIKGKGLCPPSMVEVAADGFAAAVPEKHARDIRAVRAEQSMDSKNYSSVYGQLLLAACN